MNILRPLGIGALALLFYQGCRGRAFESGARGIYSASATEALQDIRFSFHRGSTTVATVDKPKSDDAEYLRAFYLWSAVNDRVVCVVCSSLNSHVSVSFDFSEGREFELDPMVAAIRSEISSKLGSRCADGQSVEYCLCGAAGRRFDIETNFVITTIGPK